jgi:hypothetical protein
MLAREHVCDIHTRYGRIQVECRQAGTEAPVPEVGGQHHARRSTAESSLSDKDRHSCSAEEVDRNLPSEYSIQQFAMLDTENDEPAILFSCAGLNFDGGVAHPDFDGPFGVRSGHLHHLPLDVKQQRVTARIEILDGNLGHAITERHDRHFGHDANDSNRYPVASA